MCNIALEMATFHTNTHQKLEDSDLHATSCRTMVSKIQVWGSIMVPTYDKVVHSHDFILEGLTEMQIQGLYRDNSPKGLGKEGRTHA